MEDKNLGGRPPKFENPEQLEAQVQHYFDSITITKPLTQMVPEGDAEVDEKLGKLIQKMKEVEVLNDAGQPVVVKQYLVVPTISGLCNHLDITLETFSQYSKKPGFSDSCARAKQRIAEYIESEKLYDKFASKGAQFNLNCNYGWLPKSQQKHTGGNPDEGDQPIQVKNVDALSEDELDARINELITRRETGTSSTS